MKLSDVTEREGLSRLSVEQKTEIVFGRPTEGVTECDVALLLGCSPEIARERALAAAELWRRGGARYILPSGGVLWEVDGERISEAQYMARILRESGVPDGAIVLDEEARTTLENMICGALAISRSPGFHRVSRVCVVTSEWHLRRSLSLAEAFLPRHVTLTGLAAPSGDCSRRRWQTCAESVARVENELWLIWRFVRAKMIGDVEY